MNTNEEFKLEYHHGIIDHLGLKLYQNKPTNVIAELISNSWDAEATSVWIEIPEKIENSYISISDDGCGMSADDIKKNYLIIGKPKRSKQEIAKTSPIKNRYYMGRKGIGKLAPFGIAKIITIVTITYVENKSIVTSFTIDSNQLSNNDTGNPLDIQSSTLPISAFEVPLDDYIKNYKHDEVTKNFLQKITSKENDKDKHGTLIKLGSLSLKKPIDHNSLVSSIGRRFTVTLLRPDFITYINDKKVTESDALPKFDYRYPEAGSEEHTLQINGVERKIKSWVGFVKEASWPQDESGVGVYAHGKIAQDRPFSFGIKGNEIYTRYMYGVIEADWLDEFPDNDLISTERTSIDWDNNDAEQLKEECQKIVKGWLDKYKKESKKDNKAKVEMKVQNNTEAMTVTATEQSLIADIVAELGPKINKDEETQCLAINQITSAWTHKPVRPLIKKMWDTLDTEIGNDDKFMSLLEDINKHLVPESLSIGVMIAQRAYALGKLYNLKTNGTEPQLQKLLECFPWILSSDMENLTANQELKTTLIEAGKKGAVPAHGSTRKLLQDDDGLKPDFVFFANVDHTRFVIVELKAPGATLNYDNLAQLTSYLSYLKHHYPNAKHNGILVGQPDGKLDITDTIITHKTWHEVYIESRKQHVDLISSTLYNAMSYINENDSRLKQIFSYSGEKHPIS